MLEDKVNIYTTGFLSRIDINRGYYLPSMKVITREKRVHGWGKDNIRSHVEEDKNKVLKGPPQREYFYLPWDLSLVKVDSFITGFLSHKGINIRYRLSKIG